jgi:hypothetical protein
VDELRFSDPNAQRVGRFFADLMVTLAGDGVGGAESAEAIGTLWQAPADPAGPGLTAGTLVHGIGAVAGALADELAAARRAMGAADLTAADVWQEVARALDPVSFDDAGADDGAIELP